MAIGAIAARSSCFRCGRAPASHPENGYFGGVPPQHSSYSIKGLIPSIQRSRGREKPRPPSPEPAVVRRMVRCARAFSLRRLSIGPRSTTLGIVGPPLPPHRARLLRSIFFPPLRSHPRHQSPDCLSGHPRYNSHDCRIGSMLILELSYLDNEKKSPRCPIRCVLTEGYRSATCGKSRREAFCRAIVIYIFISTLFPNRLETRETKRFAKSKSARKRGSIIPMKILKNSIFHGKRRCT